MQTTIFATCRLDELLARLSADWLRGLVERNTLSHHLQPLVQQPPGRLHGYECLIRGIDPAGKPVAPREMFRAADDLGNAAAFDEKCRLLAIQRAAAADLASLPLFINFDANTIYDPPGCLRPTMEAVKAAQVDPQRIVFEAVRSERVADRRHLADVVRHLKGQGFKVSLDDVGGEPSALLSMLDLRPDYVKLDGDLVPHAAHSSAKAKVVRGVAEAARQRGIITIAKGVETDPQLKFVFSAGIRITQGWVHAKPEAAPLSIDGSKEMITRCRAAYQGVSKSAPTDGAWDLRELYEKLATSARPAADASEN